MRILFVAIPESVHTARWLSQLANQGWDLHLFPVGMGIPHEDFRNVTIHSLLRETWDGDVGGVRNKGLYWPFPRGRTRIDQLGTLLSPNRATQSTRLARTIQSLKPDIIHVLEMQNCGYLTLETKQRLFGYSFPPFIYSSWGSDLFFFGREPQHAERIRTFLGACDYYIADCQRDVSLARQLGFKGEVLGVFPTAGGYDLTHMLQFRQPGAASSRRVVALKGYLHTTAARGLVALQALEICGDLLNGFELVVYSGGKGIQDAISNLAQIRGLKITLLPQSAHDEILKLMGRARMAIGVSVSDGSPNAMLEAMVMGALPIQSNTVSTAEWIKDGKNGLLVSPANPESVANAIRRALIDDELVDRAAGINSRISQERLDRRVLQPKVIEIYQRVARHEVQKGFTANA